MAVDQFGITQLFPTKTGAREWFNKWGNGVTRVMKMQTSSSYILPPNTNQDPQDYELIEAGNGVGYWFIDGQGIATHRQSKQYPDTNTEGGDSVRLYVMDYKPTGILPYEIHTQNPANLTWTNVEMTLYLRILQHSIQTSGTPGGAVRLAARSNHFNIHTSNCDGGGYDFQLRSSQGSSEEYLRVSKELIHDIYTTPKNGVTHFDACPPYYRGQAEPSGKNQLPLNRWVGMKLVLRTITSSGHVKIEGYRDLVDGYNGGRWKKLIEYTDTGVDMEWGATDSGRRTGLDTRWATADGCGNNPESPPFTRVDNTDYSGNYNPIFLRAGYSCYFRGDDVGTMQLKKFSIREIDAL